MLTPSAAEKIAAAPLGASKSIPAAILLTPDELTFSPGILFAESITELASLELAVTVSEVEVHVMVTVNGPNVNSVTGPEPAATRINPLVPTRSVAGRKLLGGWPPNVDALRALVANWASGR